MIALQDALHRRPVNPESGEPYPATRQPGYYPNYSTLSQQNFWDEATRRVVNSRVREIPPIRFFTGEEVDEFSIIFEHILPQSDRLPESRIPILPFVDERLFLRRTPGYRFEDMPPDDVAYRRGLQAMRQMAWQSYGREFVQLAWQQHEELLKSIHDGKPMSGAEEIWKELPIHRFWALLVQDCSDVYYAHPLAWDEIGFGGPAYPRAYTRLERGEPEPWEVSEQRYEWEAPAGCLSDEEDAIATHRHHPAAGQGGTH